jgi:trk system potassium uptake protein TrkH
MLLIIIGGLGFSVWIDIYKAIKDRSLKNVTLHGKVVVSTTIILILTGALFIFMMEFYNTETIRELPISGKLLSSFFQAISPRTAGFNTLDMEALTTPTKFITIIFMFIGGSPGSTAGGIKTATAAILFLTVISVVKGKEDPEVFERHLPKYLVYRAMAVAFISLILVVIVTMLLSITEDADFMTLFFESASAFGTVGLTLGCTQDLSTFGKAIIIITMFAGRVGPLTIALALARRAINKKGSVKYPEDRIMVG